MHATACESLRFQTEGAYAARGAWRYSPCDCLEPEIMKTIAVIGGGIIGVTTAYALAQRGFAVTLFEKHRYAAMETS